MTSSDTFLKLPIIKVNGEQSDIAEETVIVEHLMKLYVNNDLFCTFSCTPLYLKELAVGHLVTCGRIKNKNDILSIDISENNHTAKIQLSNEAITIGSTPLQSSLNVKIQTIYNIMNRNLTSSELFIQTGGVHSVAIFEHEKEIIIIEDVARHNAVDKAIGYCILSEIDLRDKLLVVSGRISSDMLAKAQKAGIPVVLSKSAPTNLSIAQAEQSGITLVGFIRGERMNIYTHPARIELDDNTFSDIIKKKRADFLNKFYPYIKN